MRYLLSVPPFTDPRVVVDLAVRAEANGWDGFFLWDHLQWDGKQDIHDPWVLLGAIATRTSRLVLGTLVTPHVAPATVGGGQAPGHPRPPRPAAGSSSASGWASRPTSTSPTSATRRDPRVRAAILDESLDVVGRPGAR